MQYTAEQIETAREVYKRFRDSSGATQSEFAAYANVTGCTVSRFENGANLSEENLNAMMEAIHNKCMKARDIVVEPPIRFIPPGPYRESIEALELLYQLIKQLREGGVQEPMAPFRQGEYLYALTIKMPAEVLLHAAVRLAGTLMMSAWSYREGTLSPALRSRVLEWCRELRKIAEGQMYLEAALEYYSFVQTQPLSEEQKRYEQHPTLFPDRILNYVSVVEVLLAFEGAGRADGFERLLASARRSQEHDDGFWSNLLRTIEIAMTNRWSHAWQWSDLAMQAAWKDPSESLRYALLKKEIPLVIERWKEKSPELIQWAEGKERLPRRNNPTRRISFVVGAIFVGLLIAAGGSPVQNSGHVAADCKCRSTTPAALYDNVKDLCSLPRNEHAAPPLCRNVKDWRLMSHGNAEGWRSSERYVKDVQWAALGNVKDHRTEGQDSRA